MKRSTVAPVGMALLFLSLATVPFSLTGWGSWLSSRFDSLTDAWGQVGGVFLTVYQPSKAAQLLALEYATKDEAPARWDAQDVVALNPAELPGVPEDVALSNPVRGLQWTASETGLSEKPTMRQRVSTCPISKRPRPIVQTKSVAAAPIYVERIDLTELMKLALQSEQVTKMIGRHLSDYKIQTRFELSKLTSSGAIPRPAMVVRRGASGCSEASDPAPNPKKELRERARRDRVLTGIEFQS